MNDLKLGHLCHLEDHSWFQMIKLIFYVYLEFLTRTITDSIF